MAADFPEGLRPGKQKPPRKQAAECS
jgi:hypothetical protein